MLISIDGIDGCGKSTQVGLLSGVLGARRIQEISPSRWGKRLRATANPSLAQQLAWFTADRATLAESLEEASGSETVHIVSDRSYLSAVAYQSYDSGLTPSFLEELNRSIVPEYDLQIFLHVPVTTALVRIEARGEAKDWCEHPGLLTWADRVFETWVSMRDFIEQVDGARGIDEVAADVRDAACAASLRRFGRIVF